MKLDKRICDRCGIEYEDSPNTTSFKCESREKFTELKFDHVVDLCSLCSSEYFKFMKERKSKK